MYNVIFLQMEFFFQELLLISLQCGFIMSTATSTKLTVCKGKRVDDYFKSSFVRSMLDCSRLCFALVECESYNFRKSDNYCQFSTERITCSELPNDQDSTYIKSTYCFHAQIIKYILLDKTNLIIG